MLVLVCTTWAGSVDLLICGCGSGGVGWEEEDGGGDDGG